MNLHLQAEIFSEIFYLKPSRGGRGNVAVSIQNGNSRCKNDSGFFLEQKTGVVSSS